MATFTPSAISDNPPILPERHEMQSGAYSLFRFYRARPSGVNVYMYKVGSVSAANFGRVTEEDPTSSYDDNGNVTSDGWSDLEIVFWGGHAPTTVTASQATALTNAGYTVDP